MLYLEVGGNINDILSMNYWRFHEILSTWSIIEKRKAGIPIVRKPKRSNLELIKNLKELKDGRN